MRAGLFRGGSRSQHQARDRGNRRQSFAAEPERGDGEQVVGRADLARGVALESKQRVVAAHAAAVVRGMDAPLPSSLDLNLDAPRASVERVFQELLDDRRRPLDNLARGDFVGNGFRKNANRGHRGSQRSRVESQKSKGKSQESKVKSRKSKV